MFARAFQLLVITLCLMVVVNEALPTSSTSPAAKEDNPSPMEVQLSKALSHVTYIDRQVDKLKHTMKHLVKSLYCSDGHGCPISTEKHTSPLGM